MSGKNDLIIVNLAILLILTIFSLISGNNFISNAYVQSVEFNQVLDGTTSILELEGISADFSLDPLIQAVIWIAVIGAIGVASSITVLATGLGESGSRWLVGMIFFISIWIMLSTLPYPLIQSGGSIMELIYLGMTITYSIGCIWFLIEG